jgi:mycobactin peptide synthetase MbtE
MASRELLPAGNPALRGEDGAPSSFDRGGTMHELFASCVARYPHAVALVHHETRLTYSGLDALSDHYAVALELAGVGSGDVVPVVMKRSPELVGLLLAVLKRGAAYSAMDPQWPAERLAALVARLRARLVVTGASGPWPVPAWAPPSYDPAAPAHRPSPVRAGADDPCMILFTSGSTGAPKGVVAAHRGVARLYDACDWMPTGPGVTMAQLSASSWDGFVVDCWGPLLTGGTTVLVDDQVLFPTALSELRDKDGVNVVFLTPSLFNMLVDEGVQSFAGLQTILIGGERASSAHARRFLEHHSAARLVNLYGPTECGVLVSAHDVSLPDCAAADGIPLGRAVPYTGIYVLDGSRVCDIGEAGEICLAGAGLAIGYLDDAEATARKFADVEVDGIRRRMYRTGDLGHWSKDRRLCFDGRSDLQVQVQGYRVEPAEIELAAARVAGVAMPTVVPLRRNGEIEALALFYTSQQAQVSEADLRAELARQLPAYLVPSRIRRLDRLPVLSNGKLDRQLLELIIAGTTGSAADGRT